jgi:hypothetical protein
MNTNLYYIKYIKYKTKYLNEKNKIGGACELLLQPKLNALNPIQYVPTLLLLLNKNNLTINDILQGIKNLNKLVFLLKKFDKKCLSTELTRYLDSDEVQSILSLFTTLRFLNLKCTSLNIKKDKDNDEFKTDFGYTKTFSRGTASIFSNTTDDKSKEEVYKRNLRYLTNLFELEFDTGIGIVKSLRFGTPYAPKNSKDFYKAQVLTLRNYIRGKKCLFISLMDICDSRLCIFSGEKGNENSIAHVEIEGYFEDGNIVYLNMQCNNSVNLSKNLSVVSNEILRKKLEAYFERLDSWLIGYEVLERLRNNDNFFDKLKENVLYNFSSDPELVRKLSLQRFVLTKKFEGEDVDPEKLKDLMGEYSPCLEDVSNENIRLVMFCYVSLIFYILSVNNPNEYILLYHCKSGQDRTGTVFAINQMVNEITREKYGEIIALIMAGTSFVDIFIEFYSLTPKDYKISKEKKICPKNPKSELQINKKVELCYLRFLLFSYIITITSTGCPGIKWGIFNKESIIKLFDKRTYDTGSSVGNRFPFLLLNSTYVQLFIGASVMRGS